MKRRRRRRRKREDKRMRGFNYRIEKATQQTKEKDPIKGGPPPSLDRWSPYGETQGSTSMF